MNPFTELPPSVPAQQFYVLLVLAHGDAHVYKIKHKVEEFSKGSVKLQDGTIYPLVTRMCERGLIELAGPQPAGSSGKPRMHYSLGHHGRTALRYELDRLQHAIAIAQSAGLLDQPAPTDVDILLADFVRANPT